MSEEQDDILNQMRVTYGTYKYLYKPTFTIRRFLGKWSFALSLLIMWVSNRLFPELQHGPMVTFDASILVDDFERKQRRRIKYEFH